jgi:hypothetical protein
MPICSSAILTFEERSDDFFAPRSTLMSTLNVASDNAGQANNCRRLPSVLR